MTKQEIDKKTAELRTNLNVKKLREQYCRKSFLEIYGKSRSEDVHSSFLAWLLKGEGIPGNVKDNTLLWFMDVLMRRADEQDPNNFPKILRNAINKCDLAIEVTDVIREDASVKEDRLDILIEAWAKFHDENGERGHKVVFVIENKVTSSEHGKQTSRYEKTYSSEFPGALVIYVYVAPCRSDDLSNWQAFSPKPSSDKFIVTNYQDILDGVILPALNKADLSPRLKLFMEDYVENLYIPTAEEKDSRRIVMAIGQEQMDLVVDIWQKHSDILKELVEAYRRKVWKEPAQDDDTLVAVLNNGKDFYESVFAAVAVGHPDPSVRAEALSYSVRITAIKPRCFIDKQYASVMQVAETACEFARRYVASYESANFADPCIDLSDQILQDAIACGCSVPKNLFNATLATNNCLEIKYNGKTVYFNKNCWAVGRPAASFEKLLQFINTQTRVQMIVEKA